MIYRRLPAYRPTHHYRIRAERPDVIAAQALGQFATRAWPCAQLVLAAIGMVALLAAPDVLEHYADAEVAIAAGAVARVDADHAARLALKMIRQDGDWRLSLYADSAEDLRRQVAQAGRVLDMP